MGAHAGSERLDPGINLERRPDPLLPIDVVLNQPADDVDAVGLEDPENMGASLGGSERDQRSLLFQTLETSKVLIPIGSTLLKSISAVSAPQNETCHSEG